MTSHSKLILIIITEICIAPFPKVNQIKDALQNVEKAVYRNQSSLRKKYCKNQYIPSVLFSHSISLNRNEELLTPTLEIKNEKETEKDYRKGQQANKQGSIVGENKTRSK